MRSFMYTIKAPVGMHARHAGILVKQASRYHSEITLSGNGRSERISFTSLGKTSFACVGPFFHRTVLSC